VVARGSGTDGEVGKTGVRRVQRELSGARIASSGWMSQWSGPRFCVLVLATAISCANSGGSEANEQVDAGCASGTQTSTACPSFGYPVMISPQECCDVSEKVLCPAQGGLCMTLTHTTDHWRCVDGRWKQEGWGTCPPGTCAGCDAGSDVGPVEKSDAEFDVEADGVDGSDAGEEAGDPSDAAGDTSSE
jgi:hypothetical protein